MGCRFVTMICTHPCFRLKLSDEEKERVLSLAQLLEKNMALRPGHPVYLAKQGQTLTEAQKLQLREQASRERGNRPDNDGLEDSVGIENKQAPPRTE